MRYPEEIGTKTTSDGPNALHAIAAAGEFVLKSFRTLVNVTVITLLSAMICLILVQILGRYVFNFSIAWSEEVATFVQVWLVMLGAGVAMRRRQHVGIDILIVRCPTKVQLMAKTASLLLIVWFLYIVLSGSFGMIGIGLIYKSPALQIPMAVPYFALPIGMLYFVLELVIATLPEILAPVRAASKFIGDKK